MKMPFLAILVAIMAPLISVASPLPSATVVKQTLGFAPVEIYAVNKVDIIANAPAASGPHIFRAYIDVTAEGNLCGASDVAVQTQLVNPAKSNSTYQIALQSTRQIDVNEEFIGCAMNSKPVEMRLPLIVYGGYGSGAYSATYAIQAVSLVGAIKTVTLQVSLNNGIWTLKTTGL